MPTFLTPRAGAAPIQNRNFLHYFITDLSYSGCFAAHNNANSCELKMTQPDLKSISTPQAIATAAEVGIDLRGSIEGHPQIEKSAGKLTARVPLGELSTPSLSFEEAAQLIRKIHDTSPQVQLSLIENREAPYLMITFEGDSINSGQFKAQLQMISNAFRLKAAPSELWCEQLAPAEANVYLPDTIETDSRLHPYRTISLPNAETPTCLAYQMASCAGLLFGTSLTPNSSEATDLQALMKLNGYSLVITPGSPAALAQLEVHYEPDSEKAKVHQLIDLLAENVGLLKPTATSLSYPNIQAKNEQDNLPLFRSLSLDQILARHYSDISLLAKNSDGSICAFETWNSLEVYLRVPRGLNVGTLQDLAAPYREVLRLKIDRVLEDGTQLVLASHTFAHSQREPNEIAAFCDALKVLDHSLRIAQL